MTFIELARTVHLALCVHIGRLKYHYGAVVVACCILAALLTFFLFVPSPGFRSQSTLTIAPGTSVSKEAALLRKEGLIHSTLLFRLLYRLMPGIHGVQAGTYAFTKPPGELLLAYDLGHGIAQAPAVRITFPEGTTVRQMGTQLARVLPGVSQKEFDRVASPDEGYLFPDTYFLNPDATTTEVIAKLRANFEAHFAAVRAKIDAFGKPGRDVVIMASLLEGEGKTVQDKRIIAGILWRRIALGMPLQVDAPFGYVHGVAGYTPTAADLAGGSLYNTYRHIGLPPTPINNPGEASLEAAVTPTVSPYLYYLTGDDGQMHYARTFAEHLANEKRYLK